MGQLQLGVAVQGVVYRGLLLAVHGDHGPADGEGDTHRNSRREEDDDAPRHAHATRKGLGRQGKEGLTAIVDVASLEVVVDVVVVQYVVDFLLADGVVGLAIGVHIVVVGIVEPLVGHHQKDGVGVLDVLHAVAVVVAVEVVVGTLGQVGGQIHLHPVLG